MSTAKQTTLSRAIEFEGVGLHAGASSRVVLRPAGENHGIRMLRADLPGASSFPATVSYVVDTHLGTSLGDGDHQIRTVEHLMSGLAGCEVDNVLIEVFGEEMSVLPGMEEAAGFLWIYLHFRSQRYDVIVIDAAPTGETLRFLSLPDVGRWWMEKLFPIQRRVARVLRPAVEAVSSIPLPQEDTYDAAAQLFEELDSIHATFTDPAVTSVRLVVVFGRQARH